MTKTQLQAKIDAAKFTYVGKGEELYLKSLLTGLNDKVPGIWSGVGSAFTSYAKGDLIYASDTDILSKLAADADGKVLTMNSGVPVWSTPSGGATDTDGLPEGSTNLYFTDARAIAAVLPDQTGNAGKYLTTDGSVVSWAAVSGGGWGLTGNAGTTAGTNFIGTLDDVDFVIKRNSSQRILITNNSFFFGLNSGGSATSVTNSTFFGTGSGYAATSANSSNFFGNNAGYSASGAGESNFFGINAGRAATSATKSNFFGSGAGFNASGANNSNFFGSGAGNGATNADHSIFFGLNAGSGATNAASSTFLGWGAGTNSTKANCSVFMGNNCGAGTGSTSGAGSFSFFVGYNVGYSTTHVITGKNNILLGTNITTPDAASSNVFDIGNVLYGINCYGSTAGTPSKVAQTNGKVGVCVTTPTSIVHIRAGSGSANDTPLKLSPGTNVTTPEDGAFEYDGTHLYFTIGSTRNIII